MRGGNGLERGKLWELGGVRVQVGVGVGVGVG